jgi:hypothetical protein
LKWRSREARPSRSDVFPPGTCVVPLWDRADFMLTQHADSDDDVAFKPVQVPFKYLLIIHLRKKISHPEEHMADFFGS